MIGFEGVPIDFLIIYRRGLTFSLKGVPGYTFILFVAYLIFRKLAISVANKKGMNTHKDVCK